jgi:hypothetical protein
MRVWPLPIAYQAHDERQRAREQKRGLGALRKEGDQRRDEAAGTEDELAGMQEQARRGWEDEREPEPAERVRFRAGRRRGRQCGGGEGRAYSALRGSNAVEGFLVLRTQALRAGTQMMVTSCVSQATYLRREDQERRVSALEASAGRIAAALRVVADPEGSIKIVMAIVVVSEITRSFHADFFC